VNLSRYGSVDDLAVCREIHRHYGTTYYYATSLFPSRIRDRVHGLYAFVRVPDEWVDQPSNMSLAEKQSKLETWRTQMLKGLEGARPEHPAMRVFCDVARECSMPVDEAHCFLNAMLQDLTHSRYETYDDLRQYMRGSAGAIGILMCYAMETAPDPDSIGGAMSLAEAMQLTNFLRDVKEDYGRGRIYLPQEDLDRFGVTEADIARQETSDRFKNLMRFEIERARSLYACSDEGIKKLPVRVRKAVLLARLLYSQILNCIEGQDYDVFSKRARTNLPKKAICAINVALSSERILGQLMRSGKPA